VRRPFRVGAVQRDAISIVARSNLESALACPSPLAGKSLPTLPAIAVILRLIQSVQMRYTQDVREDIRYAASRRCNIVQAGSNSAGAAYACGCGCWTRLRRQQQWIGTRHSRVVRRQAVLTLYYSRYSEGL
jgi:hypothetical protein